MPLLAVFGYAKATDDPGLPSPKCRQAGCKVRMKQEALHQFGPTSSQDPSQPQHNLQGPTPVACQALTREARLAYNFSQTPFIFQSNDRR